jgi:hypothetical protein
MELSMFDFADSLTKINPSPPESVNSPMFGLFQGQTANGSMNGFKNGALL